MYDDIHILYCVCIMIYIHYVSFACMQMIRSICTHIIMHTHTYSYIMVQSHTASPYNAIRSNTYTHTHIHAWQLHEHNKDSGEFERLLRRCADADVRVVEKLLAQEQVCLCLSVCLCQDLQSQSTYIRTCVHG